VWYFFFVVVGFRFRHFVIVCFLFRFFKQPAKSVKQQTINGKTAKNKIEKKKQLVVV